MATDKQLAANRRNALRSTGPRSQAGKKRASQNALKHGLATPLNAVECSEAEQLAKGIAASDGAATFEKYFDSCQALVGLRRVRRAQQKIWGALSNLSVEEFSKALLTIDRYERHAISKRRKKIG